MSDTADTSAGTLETRQEAEEAPDKLAQYWLDAIAMQREEEADWRKRAGRAMQIYRAEAGRAASSIYKSSHFNILYANTEILAPAIYNSAPVPDVRERWQEGDPIARDGARLLDRALTISRDEGGMHEALRALTKDMLLPGRGGVRVRYYLPEQDKPERVAFEHFQWDEWVRGPGKEWQDVTWCGWLHYLTREQFLALNPEIGAEIALDCVVTGTERKSKPGESDTVPDMLKRGRCWEIWDKDARRVIWVAPAYPDAPLAVLPDALELRDFLPTPRPAYAISSTDTLVPTEPYKLYAHLADELDTLTRRIKALTRALRWRGAYADASMGDFLSKFKDLDDGEMMPISNPAGVLQDVNSLTDAFWYQPIEVLAKVLAELQLQREATKQVIYEITGVADIMRGATKADETLGAQQIKERNASLRINTMQEEIARYARDLMQIAAELVGRKFQPQTLAAMTGMQPAPEVLQLLASDVLRRYRIDVETDSTIQADLQRQQQNIAAFVQGLGGFITAVAPAVQAQLMPLPLVAEMVASFSRPFRLGRKVDEMLDQLPQMVAQMGMAPGAVPGQPGAPPPMDEAANAAADREHDMAKHKMTLDHQAQMERMKLTHANPDMGKATEAMAQLVQALQQMAAMTAQNAQASGQAAQMMQQQADAITQAAQMAVAPKVVQSDPTGRAAQILPAQL